MLSWPTHALPLCSAGQPVHCPYAEVLACVGNTATGPAGGAHVCLPQLPSNQPGECNICNYLVSEISAYHNYLVSVISDYYNYLVSVISAYHN
jgi:hypothetical protein